MAKKAVKGDRRGQMYEVAEAIHRLLAEHAKRNRSEEAGTCALRIAIALWVHSAKVPVEHVATRPFAS
jgi:Holliday junction resolvasome RuvABC endonuclease subunit